MSPTFLDDLDIVDATTVEATGPLYPVAQWLHGDPKLAAAGGVAHTGGVILPLKYLDESISPAPGWTRTTVAFSSGKSEAVLATQKPRLAVIRTRFRWFVVHNGVTTFFPRSGYLAETGMRGHLQALCGVPGFEFPVVLTLKGKASQEFERVLREFSQKVQDAAYRLARDARPDGIGTGVASLAGRFPRFAFYLRLAPGPHVKVGQKGQESIITPPVLELPKQISDEYLGKAYVGRERLQAYQQIFHEAAEWATAWDRPGAEETLEDHEIEIASPELA